jgi:phage tail-like protein
VIPDFWDTVSTQANLGEPTFITIAHMDQEELIFVIDRGVSDEKDQVFVFDTEGHWKADWSVQIPSETTKVESAGIVVIGDAIYIGDNAQRGVLKFRTKGDFVGRARGYEGSVTALGLDKKGNILVHPGDPQEMVRLAREKAFLLKGSFVAGPFNSEDRPVQWHRLRAEATPLPEGTHVQFFATTSDKELEKDEFVARYYDPSAENPFDSHVWTSVPRDVFDAIIPSKRFEMPEPTPTPTPSPAPTPAPLASIRHTDDDEDFKFPRDKAKYLWLGGLFLGNETVSPTIHQIRVDYNQDTYLRYLPPIYAKDAISRDFLERFLSLFESILGGVEGHIHRLPELFDPYAAPACFLPWLASWVALDLDEEWDEQKKRDAIARAFQLQCLRGTVKGMRKYLKLYANVDAVIEEPILYASLWCLPVKAPTAKEKKTKPECWFTCSLPSRQGGETEGQENLSTSNDFWLQTEGSILGYSSMLAPAHAQGAVVGTTSTLDQSHLIEDRDFGAPLFEDLAHFFYVLVYWNQLQCQSDLDKARTVIEREKPAHTDYHLCVIEPKMRVGFQSRVGVDTIVADEPPDMVLTAQTKLGHDTVISEFSGTWRREGRAGQDTRVGLKTSMT